MNLDFYGGKSDLDTDDYKENLNYKLVETSAKRIVKIYDCCEEPYISLNFTATFSGTDRLASSSARQVAQGGSLLMAVMLVKFML